jgi:hypothetical protein
MEVEHPTFSTQKLATLFYINNTPLAVLGYLIGTKGYDINVINNDSKTLTFSFNQIFENFKWCVVNIFI